MQKNTADDVEQQRFLFCFPRDMKWSKNEQIIDRLRVKPKNAPSFVKWWHFKLLLPSATFYIKWSQA
ncbi:hypothetical protein BSK56_12880 [Paenibacillus borealis]|uniref:Uncharacterized protein n=2 Tax=Paenibacillus TaxID=44249 RepID=A0ABX3HBF3_PAEBO|nr:hypothetical protein BSK56_12880 [Paenibacillus borealis]